MVILGIGIVWIGYTLIVWGWFTFTGRTDVGLADLTIPGHLAKSQPAAK